MLCLASSQPLEAADLRAPSGVGVAAVGIDGDIAPPSKRRGHGGNVIEVEQLLAWSASSPAAQDAGGTVLAGFPMSTPESVEEDVAKAHGLEIVRRFTIASIDRRIVVFRHNVRHRAAEDVVAALKADSRAASAQVNLRYRLPTSPADPPRR
jgi:hypothetical protein